ncbi:MAG: hypothetical protein H6Q31_3150, partial [Bacteroidetes bacterium]|nr:hypothetical protein [Bacteroidota bacterium]
AQTELKRLKEVDVTLSRSRQIR